MVGDAVMNAATTIDGNYLGQVLGWGDTAAQEEKVRHDKVLQTYQVAYTK